MIVKCDNCPAEYDDEFRSSICPHDTFAANDGRNHHVHHPKAYLSTDPTTERGYTAPLYVAWSGVSDPVNWSVANDGGAAGFDWAVLQELRKKGGY